MGNKRKEGTVTLQVCKRAGTKTRKVHHRGATGQKIKDKRVHYSDAKCRNKRK